MRQEAGVNDSLTMDVYFTDKLHVLLFSCTGHNHIGACCHVVSIQVIFNSSFSLEVSPLWEVFKKQHHSLSLLFLYVHTVHKEDVLQQVCSSAVAINTTCGPVSNCAIFRPHGYLGLTVTATLTTINNVP